MDSFMDTLIQGFIDWGYVGMFLSALLAGSIIPFSSELVIVALVQVGLNPLLCLLSATVGNVAGGMTCYWMGHLGRLDWIERYCHVKRTQVERMQRFVQGRGALMGFFAFLPFVGGALAVALGFMRSNLWLTMLSMAVGKLLRYAVLLWAMCQAVGVLSIAM